MKKFIAAAMSLCIAGSAVPVAYSYSGANSITANAWAPSDYCRYDNAEVPYDNSSFVNSEFYVDPSDSEIKPTLKIEKLEVPVSAAGTKQRVALTVSGADGKYCSTSFHVHYDNRLTVSKNDLSFGEAVSDMSFKIKSKNDDGEIWFTTTGEGDDGQDGKYAYIDFTIPADAAPGDLYPIGIDFNINAATNDCFTDVFNSKLMQSYLFTNGIENGYIKIVEDEPVQSDGTKVYVSIHTPEDGYVLAHQPIDLTDIDGDGKLTIDDALYIAHDKFYPTGDEGYDSTVSTYGLMLSKLWGIENGGSYGYYVNNTMSSALSDEIKNGDNIRAYAYSDTKNYSDTYSYFNIESADIFTGRTIDLTANYYTFDANWMPVPNPLEGAEILVNGEKTDLITDATGKVSVKFEKTGKNIITASSDKLTLIPPVCVVNVSDKPDTVVSGDANCDGNIDMADVVIVTQACLNPAKYGENGSNEDRITSAGILNGDVGSAYGLDIVDALLIQKSILKLIKLN
ncbi:MAG: hypothetical protein E7495_08065 [Ruminococcus flavefaciens]|nr:hypothetical protein [Ruminococcus flavefaciens]